MYATFLKHQWIRFCRSSGKESTITIQLVMGFFILYLASVSVFIGYNMEHLINDLLPGKDVLMVFNGLILYYFSVEFLMRLQLQELPTLAIVPYLHLNIPKNKFISFLNISALFSLFNILPLLLFFPFAYLRISTDYGLFACIMYLLTILSLVIFNNYAALYFKRLSAQNFKIALTGILFLAIVGILEYFKIFSIASLSNTVFHTITLYPFTGLFFVLIATGMFSINSNFLRRNLYIEELKSAVREKSGTDYPFLNRFGNAGALAALDIKLILRNKRPRATVAKGLLFLFYGLLMYKQKSIDNQVWRLIFAAVFMTGNTIMLYGQFMFSWQSAEFDGLLANKVNMKEMIMLIYLNMLLCH